MKLGETIHGYTIITPPTNDGAGKCLYAFAEQDGQEYFLKQFLDPKWPLDSSPGNERGKAIRRAACKAFEARHELVMERLKAGVGVGGGNIVVAHEFFLEGSTYYKVTERIDVAHIDDLTELTPRQQAVVLRTLGLSVQLLHKAGIVHGDLKPANILVQRRPGSELYTAKLIDFDDSYPAGQAPGREVTVGDVSYGAPEWFRYVRHDESVGETDLNCAADMFALGLILHEYLTGERIGFDSGRFDGPGGAVTAGRRLVASPRLGGYLRGLITALTSAEPKLRPNIEEFLSALDDEAVFDPGDRAAERVYPHRGANPGGGAGSAEPTSRVRFRRTGAERGSGNRATPEPVREPVPKPRPAPAPAPAPPLSGAVRPDPAPPPRVSRVRIRMDGATTARPIVDNPDKEV